MRNTIIMLIASIMFLSSFTIFIHIETCVASGNTLYVGSGQPYSNIQDAINAANESDTVYVYGGTYSENIVIDKILTLTGESSGSTTITGAGDHNTIKVTAGDVSISGFLIKNDQSSYACVFLSAVENCSISNNIVKYGGNGIYLVSSNSNTIKDNIIEYNNIGIYLSNSDSNTIQSNTIQHNNANGVFLTSTSNSNTIYLNHFSNNIVSNARDQGPNSWNYNSQGNYWDDYEEKYPDAGNDGTVWDTPYDIPGGSNQDLYPLVNQTPTADAGGPYSGYINDEITFDASNSNDPDGNIVGYQWDWTDDGTYDTNWLTTSTATHSYSAAETYTVKLQVKDNSGATDVDTTQVIVTAVIQKPTATIVKPDPSTTTTATQGESVEFHGYGIPSEGIIIGKSWQSSIDGFISSEYTFTKSNLSVGTHIIYFKVKDSNGWSDEVSTDLVIEPSSPSLNEPPVADPGGPYTGYVNVSISFNASGSYDPDGDEIVSYVWNFGDGTNGTGMSIEHTYNSTGNHTVNLTITDSKGNSSTISTYANVSIQPTDQNGNGGSIDGENDKTPGFEIILIFIAVVVLLILKKH